MNESNAIYRWKIAVVVLALSLSSLANAVTLYDESVSGDSSGGQLFPLTDGSNLFIGSQTWTDAVDGLRFIVANGRQANIQVAYSFSGIPADEGLAFVWDLVQLPEGTGACVPSVSEYECTGFGTLITGVILESQPGVAVPSSPLGPDLDTIILGPGIYQFSDNFKFSTPDSSTNGSLDYSINLVQTAVPLPSPFLLLSSGLLGLVSLARRRRQNGSHVLRVGSR